MAPRLGGLVKGPKPPPAAIPRKPLTTQGKILKAQRDVEKRKKNVPREAPEAGSTAASENPVKKAKARSFAPPDELDEIAEERRLKEMAIARRLVSKNARWDFTKTKPMTTQQKLARAKMIQKSKGGKQASELSRYCMSSAGKPVSIGAREELEDAVAEERLALPKPSLDDAEPRLDKYKTPGTFTMMKYHDATALRLHTAETLETDSVLSRATEKVKAFRRRVKAPGVARKGKTTVKVGKNILQLPQNVRQLIWKYAVVEEKYFVWPDSPTGREQPDLAMTNRLIREEVLPIYYGSNIFAIAISPELNRSSRRGIKHVEIANANTAKKPKALTGLPAVYQWASVMEAGGWLGMITTWAFDHVDPEANAISAKRKNPDEDDSFVVYVKLANSIASHGLPIHGSPTTRRQNVVLEVHREGACVLPGWKNCGQCTAPRGPSRALDATADLLSPVDGFRPVEIRRVVVRLKSLASLLAVERCL